MCTVLICFLFSGTYIFLEHCYSDSEFNQKSNIEKQLYLEYCVDDTTINPFDSYSSKLENYILYICWIIGSWNMMDLMILLGMKNIPSSKPEDSLMWNVLNSSTYKVIVGKIKKRKSHGKKSRK